MLIHTETHPKHTKILLFKLLRIGQLFSCYDFKSITLKQEMTFFFNIPEIYQNIHLSFGITEVRLMQVLGNRT